MKTKCQLQMYFIASLFRYKYQFKTSRDMLISLIKMKTIIFVVAMCCLSVARYNCLEAMEEEEELPVAAEEQARSCIAFGQPCDADKDDCQCCRTNGYCSCYSFFGYLKSGCKCTVGTTSEYKGLCIRKSKCPNKAEWGHPTECKSHNRRRRLG